MQVRRFFSKKRQVLIMGISLKKCCFTSPSSFLRLSLLFFFLVPLSNLLALQHFLAPILSAKSITEANNRLAFEVYSQAQEEASSLVFSPLSLSASLLCLYPAMDTETKAIANKYFSSSEGFGNWMDFLPLYLRSINDEGEAHLKSQVALFMRKKPSSAFLKNAGLFLERGVEELPTSSVSYLDKELPLSLSENGLLTASSFSYQAKWPKAFLSKKQGQVSFMEKTEYVPYLKMKSFEMIELVYDGKKLGNERLCLYLILPKENLSRFHQKFNLKNFQRWVRSLSLIRRQVILPEIELNTKRDFSALLKRTPLKAFFQNTAKYSRLKAEESFYLQCLWHESSFCLSVQGSFQDSAKKTIGSSVQTSEFLESFRLDKPFVFIVFDKRAEMILMMGKCEDLSIK